MGLSDELIEMLFVYPGEQGKGYGKRLLEYATRKKQLDKVDVNIVLVKDKLIDFFSELFVILYKEKQLDKVDVNEQNEKALSFYLHMGFQIISFMQRDCTPPGSCRLMTRSRQKSRKSIRGGLAAGCWLSVVMN